MSRTQMVKNRIFTGSDMDYVGICPASALDDEPRGRRPIDLLPNAKSVIVYGRRLISGSIQTKFRQFENGVMNVSGSYSAHSFVLSVNHLCMKETYDIAQWLEATDDAVDRIVGVRGEGHGVVPVGQKFRRVHRHQPGVRGVRQALCRGKALRPGKVRREVCGGLSRPRPGEGGH